MSVSPITTSARSRLAAHLLPYGLGMVLSVPIALLAGAIAEVVVALLAIPVVLLATRDLYVAPFAISYGPFAAAAVLLWLLSATALWSLALPLLASIIYQAPRIGRLLAYMIGSVVVFVSQIVAAIVSVFAPLTRAHTGTIRDVGQIGWPFTLIVGAVAASLCVRFLPAQHPTTTSRQSIIMALLPLATFSLCLALLLQGYVAIQTGLGWL